jgi:flagellar L-ring protein precursor FlgH
MKKLLVLGLILVSAPVMAGQQREEPPQKQSDNYDVLYARYLKAARTLPVTTTAPDTTWMTGLLGDLRARHVNDLVTIRVTESISGVGAADSNLDKNGNGSASLTHLFGLESKYPSWLDPTSLAAVSSNTTFSGSGSTTRSSELTATLSARVIEVLPNGDLALEGVREVDINGDIQILVLTGVVRTADIRPGNIVPSTAVGQMRIRYFGRGLMKDNLKPGWIVRVLNKIF